MRNFEAPLVGMGFRPPAKDVVQNLPAETEVLVQRQPDNPHDSNACQVLLYGFCEGGQHEALRASLREQQTDPDQQALFDQDPLHLGYIAAKTGEAERVAQALDADKMESVPGVLTFGMDGKPKIVMSWQEPAGDDKATESTGQVPEGNVPSGGAS